MAETRSALFAITLALIGGLACVQLSEARAQSPTLTVADRDSKKTYTRQDLLAHRALRDVTVADPVYGRSMTYRAIPMADLLEGHQDRQRRLRTGARNRQLLDQHSGTAARAGECGPRGGLPCRRGSRGAVARSGQEP
jgi:hypothetical protein